MNNKVIQNKRIRKGDKVVIIAGNDRGEAGVVLSRTEDRAIVQGINVRKKHVKKSTNHPQGGVIPIERPIHVSKLQFAGKDDKPVKLKAKVDKEGQRTLYYQDGKEQVTVRAVRKSK
jgi:large subunit ribosomal protein L24